MTAKSKKRKRARRITVRKWRVSLNASRRRTIARFGLQPSIVGA